MQELYKPTKADLKKVAKSVGDAFYTYPLFKWLTKDDELRKKTHPKVSLLFTKFAYKFGNLVATSENCEGAMFYVHSESDDMTTMQLIRCGALKILFTSWGKKWVDGFDKITKLNDTSRSLACTPNIRERDSQAGCSSHY